MAKIVCVIQSRESIPMQSTYKVNKQTLRSFPIFTTKEILQPAVFSDFEHLQTFKNKTYIRPFSDLDIVSCPFSPRSVCITVSTYVNCLNKKQPPQNH